MKTLSRILLAAGLSAGFFVPAFGADKNGYTAVNEVAFTAPTPTCTPTAAECTCTGNSGENGNASNEYFVRPGTVSTSFDAIHNTTHSYDKVFVCPGDYESYGEVLLTDEGTAGTPNQVVWWTDSDYDADISAYRMYHDKTGAEVCSTTADPDDASVTLPITLSSYTSITEMCSWGTGDLDSDHARVHSIQVEGDYTYVDRIVGFPSTNPNQAVFYVSSSGDASNGLINRVYSRNLNVGSASSSAYGIYIQNEDGWTVQNSVSSECSNDFPREDNFALFVQNFSDDFIGVNLELADCTDSVQFGGNAGASASNRILENSDVYQTGYSYMPCGSANGVQNGETFSDVQDDNGACGCFEEPLEVKAGSNDSNNPLHIFRNRFWGGRESGWYYADGQMRRECGASGGNQGNAISLINNAGKTLIEMNIIADSEVAIKYDPKDTLGVENTFRGNLIHDITDIAGTAEGGDRTDGVFEMAYTDTSAVYNTVVNAETWQYLEGDTELACNVFVDAGVPSNSSPSGWDIDFMAWVGSTTTPGNDGTNSATYTKSAAKLQTWCYWRKLLTGPEKVCVDHVVPRTDSPLVSLCDAFTPDSANYGLPGVSW